MKVTVFLQPDGRQREIECTNVQSEDAAWFEERKVKISMEELAGQFIVYADIGQVTEDGDPDELIVFADGRSCEDTLADLRKQCEAALS